MDSTSAPAWGEQRRAPIRARSAEDGGGAPGPSTIKGERWMDKKFLKRRFFPCRRTLGRSMRRKALRLALAEALIFFFSVVLCWQNVKFCECLLATPSFQCIKVGSVPPQWLPDAGPGGALKGASPGLGGGAESFFSVVLCWQNVKMCECLLATPSFQCIGGGSVRPQSVARR